MGEEGEDSDLRRVSLTVSPISVRQLMCFNVCCPHLVVSYKKGNVGKRRPAGSLLVGSDG